MSLDRKFGIGDRVELGSHVFGAEEIKAFAAKYDPQRFHMSEEEAQRSVFGKLCASGWHTMSMWMKLNAASFPATIARSAAWGEPVEYGPAAGLKNLKWLKPVYVGEEISFHRTPVAHRPIASRPGWHLLTSACGAENGRGEPMMSFEVNVLMKG